MEDEDRKERLNGEKMRREEGGGKERGRVKGTN